MVVLCVSENEELKNRVVETARSLQWTLAVAQKSEAATAMAQMNPDLVVVDASHDIDGWNFFDISERRNVIFLQSEFSPELMTKAFNAGADALLPAENLSTELFGACVKSLLRRQTSKAEKQHNSRLGLTLNHESQNLEMNGASVEFTDTEYRILRALVKEDAAIVVRGEILDKAFGNATLSSRSLDVHVCTLRKKLRPLGLDIVSVRGVGYRVRAISMRSA